MVFRSLKHWSEYIFLDSIIWGIYYLQGWANIITILSWWNIAKQYFMTGKLKSFRQIIEERTSLLWAQRTCQILAELRHLGRGGVRRAFVSVRLCWCPCPGRRGGSRQGNVCSRFLLLEYNLYRVPESLDWIWFGESVNTECWMQCIWTIPTIEGMPVPLIIHNPATDVAVWKAAPLIVNQNNYKYWDGNAV